MIQVELKSLKQGVEFKRKPDAHKVYIRGEYTRDMGLNKYQCDDWDDISRCIHLKGDTMVWTGFDW